MRIPVDRNVFSVPNGVPRIPRQDKSHGPGRRGRSSPVTPRPADLAGPGGKGRSGAGVVPELARLKLLSRMTRASLALLRENEFRCRALIRMRSPVRFGSAPQSSRGDSGGHERSRRVQETAGHRTFTSRTSAAGARRKRVRTPRWPELGLPHRSSADQSLDPVCSDAEIRCLRCSVGMWQGKPEQGSAGFSLTATLTASAAWLVRRQCLQGGIGWCGQSRPAYVQLCPRCRFVESHLTLDECPS